ncbi:hypothetical protein IB232_10260 [Pseudomonas sp. PDM15]|uniref:hypothetical protein n=1 Tax=Pseudomonas sp. PDM15 TaxID=2769303 RepID=UPI001780B614|nr:hypothetical protein [Pseudomonas sp. PDM15]MBD9425702.1 hypothetical protein [Pseudomonas sp. PDM15]
MTEDPRIQPLLEWNRLARENAENAIVSSMFGAVACAIEPIEKLSTWLLVGAAAVASFLITNSDKIIPILGKNGFLVCGGLLCASCLFGILAKMTALRSSVASQTNLAVTETFKEHLINYEREEQKIQEDAELWGINIQTGVRLERILSEFSKPLPWWAKLLIKWKMKRHGNNPQIAYLPLINNLTWLGYFTTAQSAAILAFLIAGFVYAAAI